jgi:hypothetical protein
MTDSALAWAISHEPTREAYRRSTGESIGPALDRYVSWLRENIIGPEEPRGAASMSEAAQTGTGVPLSRRISLG